MELDCWDGEDGWPVICHGYTLTTKIPFRVRDDPPCACCLVNHFFHIISMCFVIYVVVRSTIMELYNSSKALGIFIDVTNPTDIQ